MELPIPQCLQSRLCCAILRKCDCYQSIRIRVVVDSFLQIHHRRLSRRCGGSQRPRTVRGGLWTHWGRPRRFRL